MAAGSLRADEPGDTPGSAGNVRDRDPGTRSRPDPARPTLLVNPPTDTGLREVLDTVLEEQGPATPAELEALVRGRYPRLVVRARSLEHEPVVIWYVYREGYWVPANSDEPGREAR
jgi:hypothetical protein